jgi:hypothetical protein
VDLTPDQLTAAHARGCAFLPATEDQVRRLAVQRRIFRLNGMPFVATRDGGFFETWGTLRALIGTLRPDTPQQNSGVATAPSPDDAGPSDPDLSLAPAEPEVVQAERNGQREVAAKPRKTRTPRPKPPPARTDAVPTGETAATASEAEEMLAGVAATQASGPRARVVKRGRSAGQPTPPRWMVAGKVRRGRLK